MVSDHRPVTVWAAGVLGLDGEIAFAKRQLEELWEQRVAILRERCPQRDSGGARCTADAGHEDAHRWRPETDMPVPFAMRGRTFRDQDWWDAR